MRLDLKNPVLMFSTSRSQRQTFADGVAKLKSKSASPVQTKSTKKQPEKRVQSSTSERELGKLSVREIVSN